MFKFQGGRVCVPLIFSTILKLIYILKIIATKNTYFKKDQVCPSINLLQ
jgi:hypothetical protein